MAKITVAGNAVIITSALTFKELETVKKYRPKALVLMGGEDDKEEIFAVGVGAARGQGSINKVGATFGAPNGGDDTLATITLVYDDLGDDAKEFVAEQVGASVMNLAKLEETLPAVLEEIKADREKVLDTIEIVG